MSLLDYAIFFTGASGPAVQYENDSAETTVVGEDKDKDKTAFI